MWSMKTLLIVALVVPVIAVVVVLGLNWLAVKSVGMRRRNHLRLMFGMALLNLALALNAGLDVGWLRALPYALLALIWLVWGLSQRRSWKRDLDEHRLFPDDGKLT